MYADSDFYGSYRQGASDDECIPEKERDRYLKKAGAYLDYLFSERPDEPYSDVLKQACCEIADIFYRDERRAGIASETNDGYSVTFAGIGNALDSRAYETAVRYLGTTRFMYRGAERRF